MVGITSLSFSQSPWPMRMPVFAVRAPVAAARAPDGAARTGGANEAAANVYSEETYPATVLQILHLENLPCQIRSIKARAWPSSCSTTFRNSVPLLFSQQGTTWLMIFSLNSCTVFEIFDSELLYPWHPTGLRNWPTIVYIIQNPASRKAGPHHHKALRFSALLA